MFAIVRTGGKQYRVAAGDKITVEKLAGSVGDQVVLGDVLLAGEGGDATSTAGLTVAAEIVAQGKGEKIIIFKKKRRHNYRRKNGHRQMLTLLKIVSIGAAEKKAKPAKAQAASEAPAPEATPAVETEAAPKKAAPKKTAAPKDAEA
jgi:large subunit ribosomal protein L21